MPSTTWNFTPWLLTVLCALAPSGPASAAPSFKIYVETAGAYRLPFESLAALGLGAPLPTSDLGMTVAGEPVPIWVNDGGDGLFGPGDTLEFIGEHLRGDVSHYNEYSRYNVYRLHTEPSDGWVHFRLPTMPAESSDAEALGVDYRREQHWEEDLLRLRLSSHRAQGPEELWYSAKLVFNAKEPFTQTLDLGDLDPAEPTVDLRLHFRGWSKPRSKPDPTMADHRVDVLWNGQPVGSSAWNDNQPHLFTLRLSAAELGPDALRPGEHTLGLSVPRRRLAPGADPLIDVIMLDWIEVSYPRSSTVDEQVRLWVESGDDAGQSTRIGHLASARGRPLIAFGESGWRSVVTPENGVGAMTVPAGETSIVVTADDAFLTPPAIALDRPSNLRDPDQQADYIIIAHRTLLDSVGELASAHRARGLSVSVVDLQDVYDEFRHGIAHPTAIRDFLAHAAETWRAPSPRFVLLVGDASWDARNARAEDQNYADWTSRPWEREHFTKNTSYPYAEGAEFNQRGLIPTWNHGTREGRAASDNYFVSFAGDDHLPDMAIGRFPVVTPDEVKTIVAKTLRAMDSPAVGPWRRNTLLITNESSAFQHRSNLLARHMANHGLAPRKIYPVSTEVSNEHHTATLLDAFDEGQLLIHFLGHGGRYIWRTGPPDIEKNHDLFTLEHLEQLKPNDRLPVVLSLTCYSAPFDHPNADSIGEKLLRLDSRGAVAVFAASWRNHPGPIWGKVLVDELTQPGATVGEAILRAKRTIQGRMFVETYNLLGDPALPMPLPAGSVALWASPGQAPGTVAVEGTVTVTIDSEGFQGKLLVEAVDGTGATLATTQHSLDAPDFTIDLDLGQGLEAIQAIHAYAWDTEGNTDAIGALELIPVTSGSRAPTEPRWAARPTPQTLDSP